MLFTDLVKKTVPVVILAVGTSIAVPSISMAGGITVYKNGDKHLKMGGRIHLQYHHKNKDVKGSNDTLFFRRLRPYIEGSIHKDWKGKFQWDMGKGSDDNELALKDTYLQYKGFKHAKVTLGNQLFPFSREELTSSKKQQLVERTFIGDHNYGSPERNLGANVSGGFLEDNNITYSVALASASIDPDSNKLDFDTPVNKHKDFNQGWIAGGRVDFHPFGKLKFSQGDFKKELKTTVGFAAFTWNNDGDNNSHSDNGTDDSSGKKPDVDKVTGLEFSGAFRFMGISIDTEYNIFYADTIDNSVTKGIYKNGSTVLTNFAVEAGYMLIPEKLELVAAHQLQDADNYDENWTRTSFGANYFFKKHDIKLQAAYRIGNNLKGKKDTGENELFVQMQYVF